MLRMVWSQLRRRGGRTIALLLAILVAAGGFTVLTASSAANRLQAVGTVRANADTVYDVLVRPKGARSGLEQSENLVQPDFLSGIYGGITLAQWKQIKALPGIDVAAPIAMVGYVEPQVQIPINVDAALPKTGNGVARVDVSWTMDGGLSNENQAPDFAFVTSDPLTFNEGAPGGSGDWIMHQGDGTSRAICPYSIAPRGLTARSRPSQFTCWSRTSGGERADKVGLKAGQVGLTVNYPFPFLLAAVDPAEESRLTHFDAARTTGEPLSSAPTIDTRTFSGRAVPVLAGSTPQTEISATVTVSSVGGKAASLAAAGGEPAAMSSQPHQRVSTERLTSTQAYRQLLGTLAAPQLGRRSLGSLYQYWSISPPEYLGYAPLRPRVQPNTLVTRGFDFLTRSQSAPPGADDTAVRTAVPSHLVPDLPGVLPTAPTLVLAGTFDPTLLQDVSDVTAQVLSGFANVPVEGADARSRNLLKNKPLAPSSNLAGLVQPPPLMITSLAALPQLSQGWEPSSSLAPISAVRVRVAGVTGVDPLSRERVRVAAQRISAATGLDVDITVGSSAARQTIVLPAGALGRPELTLSQWWVKKGVAVAILKALDKKSLIIFALVLLVCALSVANSAVASVRARRTELGVLACLGWNRRHLFQIVLGELTAVALAAGALGAGLSLLVGNVLGTSVSFQRALLAIPAALAVAILAGLVPAWLAARADPMEAVRAAVHLPRRARAPKTVTGLGLVNLTRTRARALIAAGGLTVAVTTFTLLLAVTLEFQGTAVGTILGDAVAIEVRGADYAATGATLLLAAMGVANVLYLNIRDRGPEIATLRAVGWRESDLARLVVVEGLGLGLVGVIPGAALGLAGAAFLTGGMTAKILLAALIAGLAGLATAAVASAIPIHMLRRLPTAILLTEE